MVGGRHWCTYRKYNTLCGARWERLMSVVAISTVLNDLLIFARRLTGLDRHARVFNRYYLNNAWIGGGSGSGSTAENTTAYREFLASFLRQFEIKSVVDLGCGDWQFSRLIDWTGIDYLGIDVSKVVLQNTKKFTNPNVRFANMDALSGDLPAADLLLVKDVIQHWSNSDIAHLIPVLNRYKYALITNTSHKNTTRINENIRPGACRPVDLSAEPFNVNGSFVLEFYAGEPKTTFFWRRETGSG